MRSSRDPLWLMAEFHPRRRRNSSATRRQNEKARHFDTGPSRQELSRDPIDIKELGQIHMIGRIAKANPTDHDLL
jgi:hypothetical protein